MRYLLLWLIAGAGLAGAALAEETSQIERARTALSRAATALQQAETGNDRLAALGRAVTAHEIALAAYRTALRRMRVEEDGMLAAVNADRARLERLIGALQAVGQAPRSVLLAAPGGPMGVARGAGLMAEISPVLDQRMSSFALQLARVRRLRAAEEGARIEARGALAALQDLRATTAEAVRRNRRRDLAPHAELKTQAELAAREAANLAGLADALKATLPRTRDEEVTFTEARGLIQLPIAGDVTARFGDPDPWARAGQGLTVAAPAWAQVSAPWSGTVRFAGPLIDYGQVVVLEPEHGTLLVLAGLGRIDRVVGESVLRGERLGDLGGPIPASDEFLLEATTDRDEIGTEKIYIELRRDGVPVDPAPWFDLNREGNGG